MIDEALNHLVKLARESSTPHFIRGPGEPDGVNYLVFPAQGKAERIVSASPWMNHEFAYPAELAKFIVDRDLATQIFVSAGLVVMVQNSEPRNRAVCRLEITAQAATVQSLSVKPAADGMLTQKDFVRLLRINLRGCGVETLLSAVRGIKVDQQTTGNLQHTQESMGRDISLQTTGSPSIPEEVAVTFSLFRQFTKFRYTVICAVEMNLADRTFKLTPYPGEMDQVFIQGLNDIRDDLEQLVNDETQVYIGAATKAQN